MLSTAQVVLLCILICFEGAQNSHIRKKLEHGLETGKQKEPIEKIEEIIIGEEIKQEQQIKPIEIGPKHLHHWKHQGLFKKEEEEVKIGEDLKKDEEIKLTVIKPIHEYLSKLKAPLEKEEELKEDEGIKKHGRHVLPREAPEEPAPVEEKLPDDVDVNAGLPFLKPPPKPVRITLEREVVENPKESVLNTNIVSSLITVENNIEKSKERELRQAQEINSLSDLYITPRPIPAGPRPPVTIVPPENNLRTQVTVSPMSLGPVPVFAGPAQGTFSSVRPVPIFQPTVTMNPVPPVPPPAPLPSPPPPPAPKEETPIITPRRYVAYLGDMFLKLMTQLLGRARLTLNRLTGPPATSPEVVNNA